MSITHAQLRSLQDWDRHEGIWNSRGTSIKCTGMMGLFIANGLIVNDGLTPAGRDALATVPYLVDAKPVNEAPATPETVECGACDGQGVKRVAHVYELRDHSTGKLTQHTRSNLVVCDAKGCKRGRLTAKPVYDYRKDRKLVKNPWRTTNYSTFFGEPRALQQPDREYPSAYTHEQIEDAKTWLKKRYS